MGSVQSSIPDSLPMRCSNWSYLGKSLLVVYWRSILVRWLARILDPVSKSIMWIPGRRNGEHQDESSIQQWNIQDAQEKHNILIGNISLRNFPDFALFLRKVQETSLFIWCLFAFPLILYYLLFLCIYTYVFIIDSIIFERFIYSCGKLCMHLPRLPAVVWWW